MVRPSRPHRKTVRSPKIIGQIPEELLELYRRLTPTALDVWAELTFLPPADATDPRTCVRPRVNWLAARVGKSRRSVFTALKQLQEAGVLRREHRYNANGKQLSSLYVLHKLYRAAVRQHVDNSAETVDNPEVQQRQPTHGSPPTSPLVDHLPVGEIPSQGRIDSREKIARGYPHHNKPERELPPWDEALEDAYDARIVDLIRPDPSRFTITLRQYEPFVQWLERVVQPELYPGAIIEHISQRLAELSLDDATLVRRPRHWIAGYVARLNRQGTIARGRPA